MIPLEKRCWAEKNFRGKGCSGLGILGMSDLLNGKKRVLVPFDH